MKCRMQIFTKHKRFRVDSLLNEKINKFLSEHGTNFTTETRKLWSNKVENHENKKG